MLLVLCLCSAALAQKGNRYLGTKLPQGWGISRDDNLFSEQIQPVDDKWWEVFADPVLDSLISVASTQNFSVLSAMDRINMAQANLRIQRGAFFPSISYPVVSIESLVSEELLIVRNSGMMIKPSLLT